MTTTEEGADSDEIIVRPRNEGGWRVEFPHTNSVFVAVVSNSTDALRLAGLVQPGVPVRMLPA